ncbi:MAG TPA: VanW family protein [Egibacteraceae bacterium]|nr:VanW family protein [Egibacteraceae bacterium]
MVDTPQPSFRSAALARARGYAVPALRVVGIAFGVMLLLTFGLRVARAGALPGVHLDGQDVSGMNGARLHDLVSDLARERTAQSVTVVRAPVPSAGATEEATVAATGAELGYSLDVDGTVKAVLRRGRQLNPFAAFADQVRAFFGTTTVEAVQEVDQERLSDWLEQAQRRLRVDPIEGSLAFEGASVARVEPKPGADVRRDALREDVLDALFHGRSEVRARTAPLEPLTTSADVDEVEEAARRALAASVELRRGDVTLTLTPEDLGAVLTVERVTHDDEVSLELRVSPEALEAQIPADVMTSIEQEPVDATFAVSGGSVSVVESRDGFRFDAEAAAEQVRELALGAGERSAELDGEVTEPELTTQEARSLGITEQVSTFTTNFPCCQSRVRNIQRAAELVDGVVLEPGDTFSLNGHLGERTVAKGFTTGGAIYDGEFVEQVGGGVSQFTTTMFNAAFFGGYAIPQYKAHSYYISRYPVGREATLNWPNVDLKVHNNSPHGILVKAATSGTSVTVTFYGTKWVEVSEVTGGRTNVKPPPTKYKENPALAPGEERVVSQGREGFDITVTRILKFPDGREERERFFTRYLPEPRTVERNTTSPSPSPSPEPTGTASPSPSPTASEPPPQ